jgi:hypothetical protein
MADPEAPRRPSIELDEGLDEPKARRSTRRSAARDLDEPETAEGFEPAGAELSTDEELSVAVVPMRADEFRCSRCFLVHHVSQRAELRHDDQSICRECV